MKVERIALKKLKQKAGNPREHRNAVKKVMASIREFGWRQPIVVDRNLEIVAGEARYLAAQQLGESSVPVHVARDLTSIQARAYRIADNRTADESRWDDELLTKELLAIHAEGAALSITGFDAGELNDLLGDVSGLLEDASADEAPPMPRVPQTAPGDLYALGPHRLLCGDATKEDDWKRLIASGEPERPDCVFSDPPYGVAYVGKTADALTIANDQLSVPQLTEFLRAALGLARVFSRPGAAWYICAPHGPAFLAFAQIGHEFAWWRQTIVWVKDAFVLGHNDYHYRHEAILVGETPVAGDLAIDAACIGYGWNPGAAHGWLGGRTEDTAWLIPRPKANRDHPTMKPVALIERALRNSTHPGDVVVDCFGGSGSTLIACESTGRQARVLELDPRYCDVIVSRWETATGKVARRLAS